MKNLLTFATGVVLMLAFLQADAQKGVPLNEPDHNKPKLFSDLPQKLDLKLAGMDALFTLAVGSEINILVANGFHFKGVVVSRSGAQDPSFTSIVLRSDNRKGAVF